MSPPSFAKNSVFDKLLSAAGRLKWWDWVALGGTSAIAALILSWYFQPDSLMESASNPRIPEKFDAAPVIAESLTQLDSAERNLDAFLAEEQQLEIVAIAIQFRTQALAYTKLKGHPCYSRPVTDCLITFFDNRAALIRRAKTPVLDIRQYAIAALEVASLKLAIIMEKPVQGLEPYEQSTLESFSVLRTSNTAPRPELMLRQLQILSDLRASTYVESSEAQAGALTATEHE